MQHYSLVSHSMFLRRKRPLVALANTDASTKPLVTEKLPHSLLTHHLEDIHQHHPVPADSLAIDPQERRQFTETQDISTLCNPTPRNE